MTEGSFQVWGVKREQIELGCQDRLVERVRESKLGAKVEVGGRHGSRN